jgi:hypothetical protein
MNLVIMLPPWASGASLARSAGTGDAGADGHPAFGSAKRKRSAVSRCDEARGGRRVGDVRAAHAIRRLLEEDAAYWPSSEIFAVRVPSLTVSVPPLLASAIPMMLTLPAVLAGRPWLVKVEVAAVPIATLTAAKN